MILLFFGIVILLSHTCHLHRSCLLSPPAASPLRPPGRPGLRLFRLCPAATALHGRWGPDAARDQDDQSYFNRRTCWGTCWYMFGKYWTQIGNKMIVIFGVGWTKSSSKMGLLPSRTNNATRSKLHKQHHVVNLVAVFLF